VVRQRRGEQAQGTCALDHHALMGFDAPDAIERVDDRPQRAAGRGRDAVRHAVRDTHATRRRKHVAVLREAADQIRKALAVRPHVLLLATAERRRVLHATFLTLAAVHVRPQQPIAFLQRLPDRVLARAGAERDDRAHHFVAEHDGELRRRQRLRHAVPLMHVGAADRRHVHTHEERAGLELILTRDGKLADLDRLAVLGDDGGARGLR
jgi:hypothetical protein